MRKLRSLGTRNDAGGWTAPNATKISGTMRADLPAESKRTNKLDSTIGALPFLGPDMAAEDVPDLEDRGRVVRCLMHHERSRDLVRDVGIVHN